MATLLEAKNLCTYFKTKGGQLHAVDNVSVKFEKGRTMGIVGESGCGKSTLGRTLVHLVESTSGQILYNGEDITHVSGARLARLRQDIQIIFQDPYSSLDPRMTVEETLKEPIVNSGLRKRNYELEKEILKLMDTVGLARRLRMAYPHELDGGRRQRVGIGRALSLNPKFIVCDEPVSALDVSIQAQVLNLLHKLQKEMGLTYMFVTHDMSVVRHISDDISVMYLGEIIETCESEKLFDAPLHPYTKALLSAIPSIDLEHKKKRIIMQGELTSPINPNPGCRFMARCPYASEECNQPSQLEEILPGHLVACCKCREINSGLL